ncbi:hypothetical protein A8B81_16585 [Sulfitobacter pontiacus]|uniref:hypothetical protein n=1 Tax=Sulfitobacter pontiacus TaxID=60137 RepID=UPI0007D922E3|nr:hypothetical protein [Sulfitobacter pontiacus]OAN75461.1 hypothetical protein A8B81_16585 [Sulfitobacter pontiacus]
MKTKTSEEIEKLNNSLKSGAALNVEQLAWHFGVNPKNARGIAKKKGLHPDIGGRYSWRRTWRYIHGIEGSQLAWHLTMLKERYPGSMILAEIDDLEAALRVPLINFANMAGRLGERPDTLSKALFQGRATLPFPIIDMGPRKRLFREVEVRLWVDEEICLDLPVPPAWLNRTSPAHETAQAASAPTTAAAVTASTSQDVAVTSVDPATKAIFGHFETDSRINPK